MRQPLTQVAFLLAVGCASSVPAQSRLTVAEEWTSYHKTDHNGPGTYAFGYDIEDPQTGNIQFRQEEKYSNGTIVGSYGYVDPDGNVRITHYVADEGGYRAEVENSDGRSITYPANVAEIESNSIANTSPLMSTAIQSLHRPATLEEQRTPPKYQNWYSIAPEFRYGLSGI